MPTPPTIPGFRPVPFTGVIFVMAEAARRGYRYGHPDWCNLGQGQPETGPLPGAPERVHHVEIGVDDQDYAPVPGIWELRRAVAELYNALYRQGKSSRYSERNVCICGGGRASLTRAVAALGQVNLGHFLPDYTAYEELLDIFKLFTSIPILLEGEKGYHFGLDDLRREITGRGLSALLLSNPCNPTGKVIQGEELEGWVRLARELGCSLLIDEFYSHYIWRETGDTHGLVSAARYVDDVDRDPVVLFDGLTKNWRYPGWRCTWIVGPRAVIDAVSSSGSFLDGGGSKPLQRSAVALLRPEIVEAETRAIRSAFLRKRSIMLEGLREAGVRFDVEPEATFYCWGDVSALPPGINDGMSFFRAALEREVITVPGEFFDVNPGKRRSGRPSRFRHYVRFSFGPEERMVAEGVRRIGELVRDARAG
ncbi:MAG TPA: pyridoxal phosphate-dependent aminotransferase [Gemmatimonadales bacterium]|nr:pyridoxal phosphate-dependent aminotransferase [Gemmatimonadales bacterium]